jgi:hypothetical protein
MTITLYTKVNSIITSFTVMVSYIYQMVKQFKVFSKTASLTLPHFPCGTEFEGKIVENDIGSEGKMIYENKSEYHGSFHDGNRHGYGVYITSNGSKYVGQWEDDKRSGKGKEYDAKNKEYFEGTFSNDK